VSAPTTAGSERVVALETGDETLIGVMSAPTVPSNGRAVVLCPGGWYGTATNRNRVFVRAARRLVDEGLTTLRFDWHGVGESTGDIDRFALDEPFVDDVLAAVRFLAEEQGIDDVTLVGVCFGARGAFAASAHPAVRHLVLLNFPLPRPAEVSKARLYGARHGGRDLARMVVKPAFLAGFRDANTRRVYRKALRLKLRSLRKRHSPVRTPASIVQPGRTTITQAEVRRHLETLAARGAATHLLFGEDDLELRAFESFVDQGMQKLIDAEDGSLDVHVVPGAIHGFADLRVQEAVIEHIVRLATRTERREGRRAADG
jgi:pimeloyl-ACP methyl ester carboxylesterase